MKQDIKDALDAFIVMCNLTTNYSFNLLEDNGIKAEFSLNDSKDIFLKVLNYKNYDITVSFYFKNLDSNHNKINNMVRNLRYIKEIDNRFTNCSIVRLTITSLDQFVEFLNVFQKRLGKL